MVKYFQRTITYYKYTLVKVEKQLDQLVITDTITVDYPEKKQMKSLIKYYGDKLKGYTIADVKEINEKYVCTLEEFMSVAHKVEDNENNEEVNE